jgi:AAA domain
VSAAREDSKELQAQLAEWREQRLREMGPGGFITVAEEVEACARIEEENATRAPVENPSEAVDFYARNTEPPREIIKGTAPDLTPHDGVALANVSKVEALPTPAPAPVALPCLPKGWEICDLSHAMAGARQKPPWVIEDLLLAQSATQVSAHPHSMKSLAWLAAALEAVAKHTVWHHFNASTVNRSLFIESEDSTWVLEERLRGLAKGLELRGVEDAPGFHYLRTGPFDLVNMEKTLAQIFEYYRPDFVVLSTLQSLLAGRAWKEQDEMQDVNSLIVRLSSAYCPIVEITHSPWDSRQKRAIGSISQAANFLTSLHFEKKVSSADTFVHVMLDSKLGAEESDFTLRLETEGEGKQREVRGFIYQGPGWPKGLGRAAVMEAINEDPEASAKEIAERKGVSERYVQKLKKESVAKKRRK